MGNHRSNGAGSQSATQKAASRGVRGRLFFCNQTSGDAEQLRLQSSSGGSETCEGWLGMSKQAKFYRDRAERTRSLAASIRNDELGRELRRIAEQYDLLALESERDG